MNKDKEENRGYISFTIITLTTMWVGFLYGLDENFCLMGMITFVCMTMILVMLLKNKIKHDKYL